MVLPPAGDLRQRVNAGRSACGPAVYGGETPRVLRRALVSHCLIGQWCVSCLRAHAILIHARAALWWATPSALLVLCSGFPPHIFTTPLGSAERGYGLTPSA